MERSGILIRSKCWYWFHMVIRGTSQPTARHGTPRRQTRHTQDTRHATRATPHAPRPTPHAHATLTLTATDGELSTKPTLKSGDYAAPSVYLPRAICVYANSSSRHCQ